jgi:hypothetical protein
MGWISLPITATLGLAFLPPVPRFPIALLGLPHRPATALGSTVSATVMRQRSRRAKPLSTSLEQAPPRPGTSLRPCCSSFLLIYGGFCRILIWAHGRWCSQKLKSRRGCTGPLRGAHARELPASNLAEHHHYVRPMIIRYSGTEHRRHQTAIVHRRDWLPLVRQTGSLCRRH